VTEELKIKGLITGSRLNEACVDFMVEGLKNDGIEITDTMFKLIQRDANRLINSMKDVEFLLKRINRDD
jgi:hypothetical protein